MALLIASAVFWFSAALLFITYVGYPVVMALLARGSPRARQHATTSWPTVSVVLVVYNEGARIITRLENLLATDYPNQRLEVIVVSDGCTDDTRQKIASIGKKGVRLIEQPQRKGKTAGLNAGVSAARGEIVVFADARQTFGAATIRLLAEAFADPAIGAVSGELEIAPSETGPGRGLDLYWTLERWLRSFEGAVDSCIGCTGAVYAIRRRLFTPLPEDTILDDVVIPMRIIIAGFRVAYRRDATAFDPQPLAPQFEARRKQRTLAGNFQMLFRHPGWLVPWVNRVWWQLLSHKYLRLFAPLFLLTLLFSNFALLEYPFYQFTLALQLVFYGCAVFGLFVPGRWLGIPTGFVFLNLQVVRGFWEYLASRDRRGWASEGKARLSAPSQQ